MKLLLTGGTGYLGGFLRAEALAQGDHLTLLSRTRPDGPEAWQPFDLNAPPPALPDADALIHAAFDHVPGRYRGGEGEDPKGFVRRNRDGSIALFQAARRAGIRRLVFLSTRAVYGAYAPGTVLTEDLPPRPDTLYGEMKWQVEQALAQMGSTSLRVTGVYGAAAPGAWHKWAPLFNAFRAGEPVAPRQGTEVHGADLAAALRLILKAEDAQVAGDVFNVSDLLIDRHALLARYAALHGIAQTPPEPAPGPAPNAMECTRLRALGWRPGGEARLAAFLTTLAPG